MGTTWARRGPKKRPTLVRAVATPSRAARAAGPGRAKAERARLRRARAGRVGPEGVGREGVGPGPAASVTSAGTARALRSRALTRKTISLDMSVRATRVEAVHRAPVQWDSTTVRVPACQVTLR